MIETPGIVRSKDHMVGRRFVPKGYLDNQPNIIIGACEECNERKSKLESGLSAISMLPSAKHYNIEEEIKRKIGEKYSKNGIIQGGASHPETGKNVYESCANIKIKSKIGPATLIFNAIAPPQADKATRCLSIMHIQAIYYVLVNFDQNNQQNCTFRDEKSKYLNEQYIHPLFILMKPDWGNCSAFELTKRTNNWGISYQLITAKEFFKAEVRRESKSPEAPFFWALEWNKSLRIIGMIRYPERPTPQESDLPEPPRHQLNATTRMTFEKVLNPDDDLLFK
ncbi:MAG: hypothetical protein SV487_07790 [Thermodesulfobacteriota bacterium]|nr:hypothetical protein [Thermodesulfobacteriota bacterium]